MPPPHWKYALAKTPQRYAYFLGRKNEIARLGYQKIKKLSFRSSQRQIANILQVSISSVLRFRQEDKGKIKSQRQRTILFELVRARLDNLSSPVQSISQLQDWYQGATGLRFTKQAFSRLLRKKKFRPLRANRVDPRKFTEENMNYGEYFAWMRSLSNAEILHLCFFDEARFEITGMELAKQNEK